MNIKNKILLFAKWLIAGVVLCYTILYMGMFIIDTCMNGLIMTIIPLLLFFILNWHKKILVDKKKAVSHYFIKSVTCIFIGGMISYIYLFITDDPFAIIVAITIFLALLIMLIGMKVVQLIYTSTPNSRLYFQYMILGVILAINVSYIITFLFFRFNENIFYIVVHIILFVLSIFLIIFDYKKLYMKQKDIFKINTNQYCKNAIKLTSIPFLLFILPLTILYVCLQ